MHPRRRFLKTTAGLAATSRFPSLQVRSAIAALAETGADSSSRRLPNGWEFLKATLGGPWEIWRSSEVAMRESVKILHCFNAYDDCDPDVQYCQRNGWYRGTCREYLKSLDTERGRLKQSIPNQHYFATAVPPL